MTARFSIGIDLGTTSSALAYVPLTSDAPPIVLAIPQWETPDALVAATTLPERPDYAGVNAFLIKARRAMV